MSKTHYHTIIIGGGQSGLACAYYLQQAGVDLCILEKSDRIGTSRRQRYDSLCLFSPRCCNHLPGYPIPGDFRGFPSKDEIADYIEDYAQHFDFPIHYNTSVSSIKKQDNTFHVTTGSQMYTSESVILATGGFTKPYIPATHTDIDASIMQLHSSQYKNPQLIDTSGSVVIVGNGNSGVQIADDIKEVAETYLVYLRKRKRIPKIWWGRWLLKVCNVYGIQTTSRLGRLWIKKSEPVIGFRRRRFFNYPQMHDAGPILNIEKDTLICKHQTIPHVSTIIRCTGFQERRDFLDISEALDAQGKLIHDEGVSPCTGLYTIGLAWMRNKGSAMLCKIGDDANYITKHIIHRQQDLKTKQKTI